FTRPLVTSSTCFTQGYSACDGPHAVGEFWSASVSLISCAGAGPAAASDAAIKPAATMRTLLSDIGSLPLDPILAFHARARVVRHSPGPVGVRQAASQLRVDACAPP